MFVNTGKKSKVEHGRESTPDTFTYARIPQISISIQLKFSVQHRVVLRLWCDVMTPRWLFLWVLVGAGRQHVVVYLGFLLKMATCSSFSRADVDGYMTQIVMAS